MSDLVRGIVREPAPAPAPAPPRPAADDDTPERPPERVVRTPRTTLGTLPPPAPAADPPPAPAPPPPPLRQAGPATLGHAPERAPVAPAENPQALFDELQAFML
ncbi:MAG: hypothetical protein WED01_12430, partial [Candidatus Rokuibacteriota bacterium]